VFIFISDRRFIEYVSIVLVVSELSLFLCPSSANGTNVVASTGKRKAAFIFHKLYIPNYWGFGLCPSSDILKKQRTLRF
jgi:hypothetical protein